MIDVFYFFSFNRSVIFSWSSLQKSNFLPSKLCWHLNCTATSEQHCFSHNFYQHQMSYCLNNHLWTSLSEILNQQQVLSKKLPLVNFNTHFLRNFHTEFLIKIVFKTLNDLKGSTFNLCKAQLDFFHSNCL